MSFQFNISSPPLASRSDPSSGNRVVYSFNSKVMVAAMVILFVVVVFVVSLHVYAKWFWRQGTRPWSTTRARNGSWHRRRRRLQFVTDESIVTNACIGLDPSTVNSLPTFVYEGAAHEAEPLLDCAVCLSEFQVHDKGRILPNCKHSFHIDCIDTWFRSHSTCPLCRSPVSSPVTHQQLAGNTSNHPPPFQHTASSTAYQLHDDDQNTSAAQRVCPPLSLLHEPLPLLQSMAGLESHSQQEEGLVNNAGMAPMSCTLIPSASVSRAHISSHGESLCRDDTTHVSFPRMGASGSSSTRSMSTEILRQPAIARSTSLSFSRRLSEDVQAQPQKSSSFRMSIKWLLSREVSKGRSRVFPAGEIGAELEQNRSNMNLPV